VGGMAPSSSMQGGEMVYCNRMRIVVRQVAAHEVLDVDSDMGGGIVMVIV
jgi:hypothetical protein